MDDSPFYDELQRHLHAAQTAAAERDLARLGGELNHAENVARLWEQALRDAATRPA
jgi:hypothetical protein